MFARVIAMTSIMACSLALVDLPYAAAKPVSSQVAQGHRTDTTVKRVYRKQQRQQDLVLIDVRTQDEWAEGHAPGAIHVPLDVIDATHAAIANLPKDEPIYLICRSGRRSSKAADHLADQGYRTVSVRGGMLAWAEAGLPVEAPETP